MVAGSEERRIQVAFQALRTADERAAPLFAEVWARAELRHARRPGIALVAEAAALLLAIGLIFWFSSSPGRIAEAPPPDAPELALASWTSPTDFLLTTPAERLLYTIPTIRDSIVNPLLGE